MVGIGGADHAADAAGLDEEPERRLELFLDRLSKTRRRMCPLQLRADRTAACKGIRSMAAPFAAPPIMINCTTLLPLPFGCGAAGRGTARAGGPYRRRGGHGADDRQHGAADERQPLGHAIRPGSGKNGNCPTLVPAMLANREVPVMIGLRLFLPDGRMSEHARMRKARMPAARCSARGRDRY